MSTFSERLKLLRQENRYKQRELAEIFGLKLRGYQSYEYGKAYPTVPGLIQIAKFFDVSTDYLLGLSDKREVNR
ncbi:XRE family transcriptional regulator [Colidextribacter sp. OB.20]|uniref:helix-turn-helix domain-containing protein n=1 Tax=Colidextribacter sp. OB.20 TaxID=2304568 RepID=UPI00136B7D10|nr:helix-turn-helix transcriptional regulator [Colidextribacter sp. OB.20]NBI08420.1 XRE family transcriptional regulator [Colidextribacter sp. OB.20]